MILVAMSRKQVDAALGRALIHAMHCIDDCRTGCLVPEIAVDQLPLPTREALARGLRHGMPHEGAEVLSGHPLASQVIEHSMHFPLRIQPAQRLKQSFQLIVHQCPSLAKLDGMRIF